MRWEEEVEEGEVVGQTCIMNTHSYQRALL